MTPGGKADLRTAVLGRRRARPEVERVADDRARTDRLIAEVGRLGPAVVAAYLAFGTEPATAALLDHLRTTGVAVLLPATTPHPGWVDHRGPADLAVGARGRPVPVGPVREPAALVEADLVICPGLAGTVEGNRLGRGGGWYDRALAHRRPGVEAWLLLNDDEVVDRLPTDPWDRRMDRIVTPDRTIRCGPQTTRNPDSR